MWDIIGISPDFSINTGNITSLSVIEELPVCRAALDESCEKLSCRNADEMQSVVQVPYVDENVRS